MILYHNSNKGLSNLINNRFVYQETEPQAVEAPEPLDPKEMEDLQKLGLKKMENEYAADAGKKSPPLTKKEQKKYDKYSARLTAEERNEFDKEMFIKAEAYLRKYSKEMTGYGDIRTAEKQARYEAFDAKEAAKKARKAAELARKTEKEEKKPLTAKEQANVSAKILDAIDPGRKLAEAGKQAESLREELATADDAMLKILGEEARGIAKEIKGKSTDVMRERLEASYGDYANNIVGKIGSGSSEVIIAIQIAKNILISALPKDKDYYRKSRILNGSVL